jgi:putative ABC transport system permease protein
MILKYVLRNFSRRKVRTLLMVLSLMVSTGLIVAMSATVESMRQSTVDLIASEAGRYDLSVARQDTSPDPFIGIDQVSQEILAVDDRITAVHPRIEAPVEITAGGDVADGQLAALDSGRDDVGFVTVVSGTYQLGDGRVAVLADTAFAYDIAVGDTLDVSYSFPTPREKGQPAATAASERRTTGRFTVAAIVRQDGLSGSLGRQGLIMDLADAQVWLDLPGQASSLIATVIPSLYQTNNAEVAALRVRDVVSAVQEQLGDEYRYSMDKALALNGAAQAFLMVQALINSYGLIALGVVGLLVHTLVMTNVQEQRRDMAIIRILGSQRNFLFALVMVEVLLIGVIGVGLGIITGQLITRFVIVPIIQSQMAREGFPATLTPVVSLSALLPVIISALVVLFLSSLQPAREAARTKVMHAINPGVADNIQIEDLARLRERRPDFKLFLGGLALMGIFALIAGFQVVEAFGGPSLQVGFVLLAIGLIVLGLGLVFHIVTVPFEKLVLFLVGLVMPRQTYFAKRNVGRGRTRNTLISMLVLFSAVLPSFLATMVALERANLEADQRQSIGAPADIRIAGWWRAPEEIENQRLTTDFRTRELAAVPGVDQTVGLTYGYRTNVSDGVGFKTAGITAYGVDGHLNDVLFSDLTAFSAGAVGALDDLLDDPGAVVISQGLADHLALSLGDTIKIGGEGPDHVLDARIIAIASRIPGFDGIGRSRISAQSDSNVLFSLDGFRRLITPLDQPLPGPETPLLERVMFTLTEGASAHQMDVEFAQRFSKDRQLWARFLELILEENRRAQVTSQLFLLVLTTIAFTTAVFGVFAVIYVSIYARRIEIGMLKAMGMQRRELTGMLNVESIAMTLGSALAGITAGAVMGYIIFFGERALGQRPADFAMDTTVIPFIVLLIVLASMISASLSARRIVKKRAVEILRMQ